MADDDIPFDRSLDAKPREISQVSPLVRRLIAGNAGPFTFTGTCTYIVGREEVVVIDPGPTDKAHGGAILEALRDVTVKAILVTHTHRDHSPGALALKAATGAPILGPVIAVAKPMGSDAQAVDAAHDQTYAPRITSSTMARSSSAPAMRSTLWRHPGMRRTIWRSHFPRSGRCFQEIT